MQEVNWTRVRLAGQTWLPSLLIEGETYYTVVTLGSGGQVTGVYQAFMPKDSETWNLCCVYRDTGVVDVTDAETRRKNWW